MKKPLFFTHHIWWSKKRILLAQKEELAHIATAMMQTYGELNRIRLILTDKKYGKKILDEDKKGNHYIPFFDEQRGFDIYQAAKSMTIPKPIINEEEKEQGNG